MALYEANKAGFQPTWPISSNRAPRQTEPSLRLLANANVHFLSKLLVYCAGGGPVFFQLFGETKTIIKFSQRSLKTQ